MSQDKHDILRQDIEDYKKLLLNYQSLRVEIEILTTDFQRQSKLLESRNDMYDDAMKRIILLEGEVEFLGIEIENQSATIAEKERLYIELKRMYYAEKRKVSRMIKAQKKLYVWKGIALFFFVSMLLVGSR